MKRRKLPKTYDGAKVVRGRGMKWEAFETLEDYALDSFTAGQVLYVVIGDDALTNGSNEVKAFTDGKAALLYARACGNGNCDYRVLTVTAQTLVVATENNL